MILKVLRSAKTDKTYFVHLELVKESVLGARSVNGFIQMEIEGDDAPDEGTLIEFDFAKPEATPFEQHESAPDGSPMGATGSAGPSGPTGPRKKH